MRTIIIALLLTACTAVEPETVVTMEVCDVVVPSQPVEPVADEPSGSDADTTVEIALLLDAECPEIRIDVWSDDRVERLVFAGPWERGGCVVLPDQDVVGATCVEIDHEYPVDFVQLSR